MIDNFKRILNHPLFKNSLFNSGGFVFISLVGLIITPLLVHHFGLEPYGVYILVTGIFGYYGIFDFGLGQALIKFAAQYKAQNNIDTLNDAVNSVLWFQFFVGVLLSATIYFTAKWIIHFLNVSQEYSHDSVIALKLATIGFLFSMLSATFGAAIKGLERYDVTSIIDSVSYLVINVLLLLVVLNGYGIKEAVLVNVSAAMFQLIVQAYAFKKLNSSFQLKVIFKYQVVREFLSFSAYLFLSKITGILRTHGARLIISAFLNPSAVTLFVVPSKLLTAVGGVLGSAAGTLFPYVSKLNVLKDHAKIKDTFIKVNVAFTFVSLPVFLFTTFFSKSILTLWMGPDFAEKSWLILSILSLSSFFASLTMIPIHTILGLGFSRLIFYFSIINLVLYSSLLPLFTYKFRILGAALAMLIISSLNILFVLARTVNAIGLRFNIYMIKIFKYHLIPTVLYSFATFFVIIIFNLSNLYNFFIGFLMLLVCYYYYSKKFLHIFLNF